ncbi:TTLL7 polyglutamylase, partial [Polypterus senegalus]
MTLQSAVSYKSTGKRKIRQKKKKGHITANVAGTKYEIVRIVIDEMVFMKTRDEDETANLIWNDSAVQHEKIAELRNYQLSPSSTRLQPRMKGGSPFYYHPDVLQVGSSNPPRINPRVVEVTAPSPETLRVSLLLFFPALPGVAEVLRSRAPKAWGCPLAATTGPYRVELQSSVPVAPKGTRAVIPRWSGEGASPPPVLLGVLAGMIKIQPQEYSFIPKTWIFPAEYTQFQNYVKELRKKRKQKTFIVKPANGAMGHGISLIRNCEKLPLQDHFIVQEYLEKPFLMEGYKFDLRIYILVTSCDPLRIFLYNDGLVRMGTEKYHPPNESNLLCMHLTNYSVNKHNENFGRDETADRGSKRSIRWFTEFLRTNDYDVSKFWGDISELVVKTLIVAEPHVLHAYRMCRPGQPPGSESVCFEVLGFDIILDRKLKPWLLEQLCSMPETTQTPKKQKEYSSNSSCNNSSSSASEEEFENEDILEKQEKKVSYDLEEDKNKSPERSSRINWKPPSKPIKTGTLASPSLSSPIRRSISCPRSISSLTGQSPTNEQRAASAKPSTPTVRPSSVTRSQSLNRTGSGSRVPQSSSLGSIHSMASRTFAFHKVICITSWETIFSKSTEVVTPEELQCCQRLVQLCRDCLLVVYKFVADSRGSLTGLSPEWDDTRYLLPVTSQFLVKCPSGSFSRTSSGLPRSRSLFTTRLGQF